ncbi:hypothetical protein MPTK1_4g09620 [Marchantia polymorpha subsp. ruderalis]|uniref:Uncharacterized protein n=2 Tax=Marchantia polymorpha TaxID=3197 RepID=A0AAF6B861_MARPO|nr:hypothetical protein MARPO_0132s0005 [Marchantia polymorpha]BBN08195.1 hypothetical protein Mp_4g09620 [Marchantia polymorpha subsp. ruderalis]|eukprot:PTQ29925.1 hypothetical protein MARPO_0132s0005 [Marchantia polymorpha]
MTGMTMSFHLQRDISFPGSTLPGSPVLNPLYTSPDTVTANRATASPRTHRESRARHLTVWPPKTDTPPARRRFVRVGTRYSMEVKSHLKRPSVHQCM